MARSQTSTLTDNSDASVIQEIIYILDPLSLSHRLSNGYCVDWFCVYWNVHCSSHEGVFWPEGSTWHKDVVYGKTVILSRTVLSKHSLDHRTSLFTLSIV